MEDIDTVPLADLLRALELVERYGVPKQTKDLPKEIYKELLETRAHLIPDQIVTEYDKVFSRIKDNSRIGFSPDFFG